MELTIFNWETALSRRRYFGCRCT